MNKAGIIDSHCHLDFPAFDSSLEQFIDSPERLIDSPERLIDSPEQLIDSREHLLQQCHQQGFQALINPSVAASNWSAVTQLAQTSDLVKPAYGLHPLFLNQHTRSHLAELETLLSDSTVVAVGEIGLDYFDASLDPQTQQFFFEAQLAMAQALGLPVILHIRKAYDQVLKTLRGMKFSQGGIAHAFSGSEQQARQFIDMGFVLGFGGAATYPRARKIRGLVQQLPISSLVLETDAPDMAPVFAEKGKNSPLLLPEIAAELARLRDISTDELISACTENTCRVLRLSDVNHELDL